MNIVTLETFLTIVEAGSLVRASEKLNVTQSTVTARLQALEDELGQTLLLRQKSGATLTPAGHKLMRYAEVMTGLWRQARQETSLPAGTEALCNFGCHVDLWRGPGQRLFESIAIRQPHMALSAYHGEQGELDQLLGSGLLDLAVCYQPSVRRNQTIRALPSDRLVLYTTRAGSPMKGDPLYIYVDLGEDFRSQHAAAYADAGVARISFGCALWALEYLMQNDGSAYLPERLAQPHVVSGRLHEITEAPVFIRNVYLVSNDATAGRWGWLEREIAAVAS